MIIIIIIIIIHSISRDELYAPLTQYIANAGITRARYTITHFQQHHRVPQLISNRLSAIIAQCTYAPREVKNRDLAFFFLFLLLILLLSSLDLAR